VRTENAALAIWNAPGGFAERGPKKPSRAEDGFFELVLATVRSRAPEFRLYPAIGMVVAIRGVASEESSLTNFGLVIAYVLPGFTALQGFPLISASQTSWGTGGDPNPTLTAFLSGTVMALAAGLTVSAVRWLLIDKIHHRTGLRPPARDFSQLDKNIAAYEYFGLIHYRYYKFYANMVVALVCAYATRDYALGWRGLLYLPLAVLFFVASRDSLRKYYDRTGSLLRQSAPDPLGT
jgi:hypothetical protein